MGRKCVLVLFFDEAKKEKRGVENFIPEEEVENYNKTLARAIERHSLPAAPAMPIIGKSTVPSALSAEEATGDRKQNKNPERE